MPLNVCSFNGIERIGVSNHRKVKRNCVSFRENNDICQRLKPRGHDWDAVFHIHDMRHHSHERSAITFHSLFQPCQRGLVESVVVAQLLIRSEEHTSELQSLMRISYAVFCLKKKKNI